jgi:MraZ protein
MTAVWRGRFSARLDSKGRLSLPGGRPLSSSRNQKLFVTNSAFRGQKFLDVYPEKEWLKIEQKISAMPSFQLDVQAFRRFYISSAVPIEPDAQGRVLIPQELRDYAELGGDIVIVGVYNHFEVWDRAHWMRFNEELVKNFDQIQQSIAELETGKKK